MLIRLYVPTTVIVFAMAAVGCSDSSDSDSAAGATPNPLVMPASGGLGRPSGGLRYDVTQFGYQEREYFFEGTARTYPLASEPPATYRSRMIVWTPIDPARFNGTTVVEWAHVSVGAFELTAELRVQSPMLEEQGYAFVLVSAQEAGVCGKGPDGCGAYSVKGVDPARYGSLNHPGEAYSFDIFNQALQAIKYPSGTAPLGELVTRFIIAEGFQPQFDRGLPIQVNESPGAAGPLNAYLANGAADARLADAFLLDSAAPLVEPAEYPAPTLHHLDESAIRRTPAPNGPSHVTWEVVGAPHVDRWSADHSEPPTPGEAKPLLNRQEEEARRAALEEFRPESATREEICLPIATAGTLYPRQYTLYAALAALREWLETGVPAPAPPHIERVGPTPASGNMKLSRDSDGNAIGGLRLPIIQVPVAAYNGEACVVGGTTVTFSPERLAELYPTHQSYVEQMLVATDEAVESRLLLCRDAQTIMRKASESGIGGDDQFTAAPACAQ
jgi:hypothetical protein